MSENLTLVDELQSIIGAIENAASQKQFDKILGEVLREHFGMEETVDARYVAFAKLARLCGEICDEVDRLSLSEARLVQIRGDVRRITGKLIGVGPDFTLNNWPNNFDQNFLGPLNYVAMALEGEFRHTNVRHEAVALADDLTGIMESVLASNFPPAYKNILTHRVNELIVSLRNVMVWGYEGLRREIVLLSGEAAIAGQEHLGPQDRAILKRIKASLGSAFSLLAKVRGGSDDVSAIAANGAKLLALVGVGQDGT